MRISYWSSDVCSSDRANRGELVYAGLMFEELRDALESLEVAPGGDALVELHRLHGILDAKTAAAVAAFDPSGEWARSEERREGKECVSPCRSRWSPYH